MQGSLEQQLERKMAFVQELKCLPVAVQTAAANEQHYEVSRPPLPAGCPGPLPLGTPAGQQPLFFMYTAYLAGSPHAQPSRAGID